MNRTFHSHVDSWYWLLMAVTAFFLFDFFWFHYTVATILTAILMIFEIEMLIHTQYVITSDGKLQVESGRFVPDRTIDISSIQSMREIRNHSWAPALSSRRVEIVYQCGEESGKIMVSPQSIPDFILWIQKKQSQEKKTKAQDL